MSTGQQLNQINIQLGQLLRSIKSELINVAAAGKTPNVASSGHTKFWQGLSGSGYLIQLKNINRRLLQIQNSLMSQQTFSVHARDLEERRRLRQSITDKSEHLTRVESLASEVEEILRRLYFVSQVPTNGELIQGINKIGKEGIEFFNKLSTEVRDMSIQNTESYIKNDRVTGGPALPLTLLVTLITLYIAEKMRQGNPR